MKKDTPTEVYKLKGREVLVKRDDLMGDGNTLPPWGKLAGIDRLLHRYINPKYPLIHLAVNGSWSGWALSHLCKQRDIKFVYAYPPSKTYSRFILNKAKENGCDFHELKPNMMAVLYAQVQSYAKRKDIQMLPYAFDHVYYRNCMASRARNVFEEYPFIDHLVISAGSGCLAIPSAAAAANFPIPIAAPTTVKPNPTGTNIVASIIYFLFYLC